jgi:hypothetical protein
VKIHVALPGKKVTFLLKGNVDDVLVKYLTGVIISCAYEILHTMQSPPPVYRIPQHA